MILKSNHSERGAGMSIVSFLFPICCTSTDPCRYILGLHFRKGYLVFFKEIEKDQRSFPKGFCLQYITLFISLNLCFIRIAFEICSICSHSSFSRLFFACSSWWPTSTIFLPLKFIIHIKLRPSNPHVSCHRHRFAYFGRTRHSCAGFLLNHPGGLLKQSLLDLVALIILILVLFLLVLVV